MRKFSTLNTEIFRYVLMVSLLSTYSIIYSQEYSISGSAQFYAAGGGGGNENHVYNQAARASGIGGQTNPSQNQPCTDGIVNTGSGGGGVTHPTVAANGTYAGDGASGIVIIRYPL